MAPVEGFRQGWWILLGSAVKGGGSCGGFPRRVVDLVEGFRVVMGFFLAQDFAFFDFLGVGRVVGKL